MNNQRWRTFGRLEGQLERQREKETQTDGQTNRQTDKQTEGENIYLINVVTSQTQYTHRARLFLRQLYKLQAPTAHAWTFARVCVQAVEFAAKLMHFVPQLDYPGDWRKAVSAISGNVARERFDEVPPTSKLVSATSDENSPLPLPSYVTMGRFYPYHPHLQLPCQSSRGGVSLAYERKAQTFGNLQFRREFLRDRSTANVIGTLPNMQRPFTSTCAMSNRIHCWAVRMLRLQVGLLKLPVVPLILRVTGEGQPTTFSGLFGFITFRCVFVYVYLNVGERGSSAKECSLLS